MNLERFWVAYFWFMAVAYIGRIYFAQKGFIYKLDNIISKIILFCLVLGLFRMWTTTDMSHNSKLMISLLAIISITACGWFIALTRGGRGRD